MTTSLDDYVIISDVIRSLFIYSDLYKELTLIVAV